MRFIIGQPGDTTGYTVERTGECAWRVVYNDGSPPVDVDGHSVGLSLAQELRERRPFTVQDASQAALLDLIGVLVRDLGGVARERLRAILG